MLSFYKLSQHLSGVITLFQWRSQDLEIGLNKGGGRGAEGFLPLCENSVVYDNL